MLEINCNNSNNNNNDSLEDIWPSYEYTLIIHTTYTSIDTNIKITIDII